MVSRVMYHQALSAAKMSPPSSLPTSPVTIDAISTPMTAARYTNSSVVFQDGLVSSPCGRRTRTSRSVSVTRLGARGVGELPVVEVVIPILQYVKACLPRNGTFIPLLVPGARTCRTTNIARVDFLRRQADSS